MKLHDLRLPALNTLRNLRRKSRADRERVLPAAPRIECLEQRIAPANIVVTVSGHTLNVVGTDDTNSLTVKGVLGDATQFTLTAGGDTINNSGAAFTTPTGITSISIKLLGGDDTVTFTKTVPMDVKGSLTIDGGDGANSVTTTDLTVEKDLSITNGINIAGTDTNTLANLNVKGSVTIANGDGDTKTTIQRTTAGLSSILGNLSITNGAGEDLNTVFDENIGGNFTVNNGKANSGGIAGYTEFYNFSNTSVRSMIGGNVSVTYLDGDVSGYDGIWDAEIGGNVTFNHGSGTFVTNFDGFETTLPVVIHGGLTINGTGKSTVTFGTEYQQTGLILGKDLHITSGAAADSVTFNQVRVEGSVSIAAGDGANTVTATDLDVAKALSITNGKNTTGTDTNSLSNLKVLGSVTINNGIGDTSTSILASAPIGGNLSITNGLGSDSNSLTDLTVNGSVTIADGDGDTHTTIARSVAGSSTIFGNLSLTNGIGQDSTLLRDESFGASVTINNGKGDNSVAGYTDIYNFYNTTARLRIGGNVAITDLSGDTSSADGIWDAEIGGNVTFNHGTGNFTTHLDGNATTLPDLIHGSLAISGTGSSTVSIGVHNAKTGLIVDKNLSITSGAAADSVNLNKVLVGGSVSIAAGDGANTVTATDLTVAGALAITNGKNTTGTDTNSLSNLKVLGAVTINNGIGDTSTSISASAPIGTNLTISNGLGTDSNSLTDLTVNGSVTIANGDGNTTTSIVRSGAGSSTIFGNLSITNGIGRDTNFLGDENVGGSVTINNGKGDAGSVAGVTQIYNLYNTTRLRIGGNVSITYLSGDNSGGQFDTIWDAEIGGNVTFNHGTGNFTTVFDGNATTLPDLIHGSLTLNGTGQSTVSIGVTNKKSGLIVDKNLSITSGAAADSVTVNKLLVGGNTSFLLGDGANTTTIDDSVFSGTFTLTTGKDADTINLETTAGSSAPTIFGKAVLINEGAGADTFIREGGADANQAIYVYSTFVIHNGGNGGDSQSYFGNKEFFPFFTLIQSLP